jgi:UDP-glucuronate decarboxylase
MNQVHKDIKYINQNFKPKKYFEKKNILITGAAGFIGFLLSEYFIKNQKKLKYKKLFLTDINKKYLKKKVSDKFVFKKKFDVVNDKIEKITSERLDIIIHAASIASPSIYRKNPLKTADANVIGLRKILEYSKVKKIKKILYFSSSEIYGSPEKKNIPTSEEYNGNVSAVGPRACYDEAKRYCETLCYIFNKEYKTPISIVRPFNNFGPGMQIKDMRLPSDLAKNIIHKKNLILYSNGNATRSFCYISDAIIGYLKALIYPKFEIFNIGNQKNEITVKNFALLFARQSKKILNYYPKIIFKKSHDKDYLTNNPDRRCPNINKAKKNLNFFPTIKIEEGIRNYINFLMEKKDD